MHYKFVAFLAVLAAAIAFLSLPGSAMAETVTLKKGEKFGKPLGAGAEVRFFGSNFALAFGSGVEVECAESETVSSVTENPGAVATVESSRFEGASEAHFCLTDLSPRVKARVKSVTFSSPMTFSAEGGSGFAETMVKFTTELYDRAADPEEPVAECTFKGMLELEYTLGVNLIGGNKAEASGTAVNLPKESLGECGFTADFSGDFEITTGEGATPVLVAKGEPEEGEEVNLRDINGEDPGSIRLTSGNLKTETASGVVACSESVVNATRSAAGRYTPTSSSFRGGGTIEHAVGKFDCPVLLTGGRFEARVRPVEFRSDIHFRKVGGEVKVEARVDFELLFRDKKANPTPPHAIAECKYEVTVKGTMTGDVIKIDNGVKPKIVAGGQRIGSCGGEATLTGEFRVTERNGEPVVAS